MQQSEPTPGIQREVLVDLPLARLQSLLADVGQPAYRAGQIFRWLHLRNAGSLEQMTDLPRTLREELAARCVVWPMRLSAKVKSSDGSIKYGWMTPEGDPVEAVVMPGFKYGTAICVSSQSGCGMACKFCETGYMGLRSYLSAGMILQQLYQAEADSGVAVDRIVFMGMGEPLLNLRAIRRVIGQLCGRAAREFGRGWSPRRITVSTVGLVQPILKMADTFPRVNLALSLHFTTNDARKQHMPQADSDVTELAEALYYYRQINGGKVTIEYALMKDINDTDADAQRLIRFARLGLVRKDSELVARADARPAPPHQQALPLHVNLIAYNPIPSAKQYLPTSESRIDEFARILRDAGIPVTVRHSRGQDVAAACGQLGAAMLKGG
ncbi:23S rRNA (adenine(2503)-C(2))-methyltransferase RlmN [bacterium]|nr:23S rRNA (adenine(2503)-C(2))-methyltransferase RlmN [bacterium]